jgi:predicted RNA-binding protein with PIN domain
VENGRPQGSVKNDVVIFFDGRPGPSGQQTSVLASVIFTQDKSADDRIKEAVENSRNAKNIIVVTDDRAIQYAVRANGAKVEAVSSFLNKKQSKTSRSQKQSPSPKDLSNRDQDSITSEFKDIWLKKKKRKD